MRKVEKINSLNGIRGFAVLLVLLSHASKLGLNIHPSLSFSGAGRYGVFLFFVLSAFLLTRQFFDSKLSRNEIKGFIAHYFLRRGLRIHPLFTVALIVYYLLYKTGFNLFRIDGVMLLKSFFLLDTKGVFWTILVEFQYYFLLPIVALAFLYTKKPFFILVAILIFVPVWWNFIPPNYEKNLLPFLPIFILGSASAFISTKIKNYVANRPYLIKLSNVFAMVSVFLFITFIPNYYNYLFGTNLGFKAFHKEFLLFALLSCCLILFTIHGNGIVKKIMENRIMVFWGNISFSAYLWHTIILRAVDKIGYTPLTKWFIFIIITASFSYLSFKYFELPLSKYHVFKQLFSKFGAINNRPPTSK